MPWSMISYAASDIAVEKAGDLVMFWFVGTHALENGYAVFKGQISNGTLHCWQAPGTGLERIGAAQNAVYGIGKDQKIVRLTGQQWETPPGLSGVKALDVFVKSANSIFYLNDQQQLFHYNGLIAQQIANAPRAVRLAVGDAYWLANSRGEVYTGALSGESWTQVPDVAALDVAAYGSSAWVIGKAPRRADGGMIYQKTPDGWLTRGRMGIALACASETDVWVVNYHGAILRYS